jgi:hypothetical protein
VSGRGIQNGLILNVITTQRHGLNISFPLGAQRRREGGKSLISPFIAWNIIASGHEGVSGIFCCVRQIQHYPASLDDSQTTGSSNNARDNKHVMNLSWYLTTARRICLHSSPFEWPFWFIKSKIIPIKISNLRTHHCWGKRNKEKYS